MRRNFDTRLRKIIEMIEALPGQETQDDDEPHGDPEVLYTYGKRWLLMAEQGKDSTDPYDQEYCRLCKVLESAFLEADEIAAEQPTSNRGWFRFRAWRRSMTRQDRDGTYRRFEDIYLKGKDPDPES